MGYTVAPYLVQIDDMKKAIGGKDRTLAMTILKQGTEEQIAPAVNALLNGDLHNKKIAGFQYGYALEAMCEHFGKREGVEALESVHFSDDFAAHWSWLFNEKPLISFNDYNEDFPIIGYLLLADIPEEIKRTKKLKFDKVLEKLSQGDMQQQQAQLEMEVAMLSAGYETAAVSPADFPWLDESYYDSVQQELESLGFHKVHDEEHIHASRLMPETRYFYRTLINAERNISAIITQIRVVEPKTDEQKHIDVRTVEFSSEFPDGTFVTTANALSQAAIANIDGFILNFFPPSTPTSELLNLHKMMMQVHQHTSARSEPCIFATDDDLESAGKRQQSLMRADRQKRLQALKAGTHTEEPDEELIEWLEEIRAGLLALYKKAVKTKTDIVTFYY
jgi:hypothetical protein